MEGADYHHSFVATKNNRKSTLFMSIVYCSAEAAACNSNVMECQIENATNS